MSPSCVAPLSTEQHLQKTPNSFTDKYFQLKSSDSLLRTIKKITLLTLCLATFGLFFLVLKAYDYFSKNYIVTIPFRSNSDQTISDDGNLAGNSQDTPTQPSTDIGRIDEPVVVDEVDGGAGSQIGYITILRIEKKINLDNISRTLLESLEENEIFAITCLLTELDSRQKNTTHKTDAVNKKLKEISDYSDSKADSKINLPLFLQKGKIEELDQALKDKLLALVSQIEPGSLYA